MVLVSAPTGTGKTRSVLAPAAVLWGGPRWWLAPRTTCSACRTTPSRPSALIDLRPDYDATYPGVTSMSFDPTKMITTPDQAVTAATR